MCHIDEPFGVAVERQKTVNGHDAEIGGHNETVDDVQQGRTTHLETRRLNMASQWCTCITQLLYRVDLIITDALIEISHIVCTR